MLSLLRVHNWLQIYKLLLGPLCSVIVCVSFHESSVVYLKADSALLCSHLFLFQLCSCSRKFLLFLFFSSFIWILGFKEQKKIYPILRTPLSIKIYHFLEIKLLFVKIETYPKTAEYHMLKISFMYWRAIQINLFSCSPELDKLKWLYNF